MTMAFRFATLLSIASSSFARADPHLRKDLNGLLLAPKHTEHGAADKLRTPEAKKDRILKLPGLDFDPGFDQYSGYLTVSQRSGRYIFYYYVESQRDPKNDPVVIWTNGGPGCSGLLGWGTEHGPFIIHKNGTLTSNPHSWNKVASIIYVEQPAGVGFSYSETKDDYNTGDAKTAMDNYSLIVEFLKRFPERQSNDFYIASESYGGHYIPQLTLEILERNKNNFVNLKGFMVGNPYVDPFSNTLTQFASFYVHGLLAKPLYNEFTEKCSTPKALSSSTCFSLQRLMRQEFGDGINPYALDFPVCIAEDDSPPRRPPRKTATSQTKHFLKQAQMGPPFLPEEDEYYPCQEEYLTTYLNRWGVQTALHAHVGGKWKECSDVLHYNWQDVNTPQVDLYQQLIDGALSGNHSLRMLVYSGDDDSVCSTAGTQEWIYDLGVNPMEDFEWEPWTVDDQTAGFVTQFDMGKGVDASLSFVTVHGAGHEVPAYRPMEAFAMFKTFIQGQW